MRQPSPQQTSAHKYVYQKLLGLSSKKLRTATKRIRFSSVLLFSIVLFLLIQIKLILTMIRNRTTSQESHDSDCAINLFGLPRAFDSLVLPSLIQNVIQPNAVYNCDYFVHFYDLKQEAPGRSGAGGVLQPEQVYHLQQAVQDASRRSGATATSPTVKFVKDSEEEFWKQYGALIEKIKTVKSTDTNKYKYFPWKAKTYDFPVTVVNIIKMWHSIQAAWNLMESTAAEAATVTAAVANGGLGNKHKKQYIRVAMLRSDVVYMTPIDIYTRHSGGVRDDGNEYVVVPGFGKYPVSDRIVYGPYDAVKIWASERFQRMEDHVEQYTAQGWAMHSERFVAYTLFPAMRSVQRVKDIVEHDTLCFFRARVDESVWISDCGGDPKNVDEAVAASSIVKALGPDKKAAVEKVLGRKCGNVIKLNRSVRTLTCPQSAE